MKKIVIIINGTGGAGKDTLCEIAAKHYKTSNISSITPIKKIARENGWNGEKDAKSRKFLADLKQLFAEYNDLPTRYLFDQYRLFLESDDELLFAHIREKAEIDKFKDLVDTPCVTLLVERKSDKEEKWGNASDDEVRDYDYDFVFENDGTIEDAERDFTAFLDRLFNE